MDEPDTEGHFLASLIWAVNGEYFTAPRVLNNERLWNSLDALACRAVEVYMRGVASSALVNSKGVAYDIDRTTHRRGFLGRLLGAAAAGLPFAGARSGRAGVSTRRLDEGRERHPPVPLRFPAAQERVAPAAHPQLPEYLLDGLQDRTGPGRRGRHFLQHRKPIEHSVGVQRRDLGQVPARRIHRAQGCGGEGLHPQCVPSADEGRFAPADAGDSVADHSRVRPKRCRASASRACRRWAPSS